MWKKAWIPPLIAAAVAVAASAEPAWLDREGGWYTFVSEAADVVLDQVHDGVMVDVDAEEIESSAITLQGLPARDFVYRIPADPPALERARVVLVEGRLYVVTGRVTLPADPTTDLERFFESFHFERSEPGADGEPLGS